MSDTAQFKPGSYTVFADGARPTDCLPWLRHRAVRLMGPRSPFWRCCACSALQTTPIFFRHRHDCVFFEREAGQ